MSFQDPTEELVYGLCRRSFLSLWSYANPRRHGSPDELCDALIVCEPHVLLFSVKYCDLNTEVEPDVALRRWWKKAVDGSVRQLYGAERNLRGATHVTRTNGQQGLPLPALEDRKVHRIAVSLGGKGIAPVPSGDFGKGIVHVFDDFFLHIALQELDTVSDFIAYLEAKERLLTEYPRLRILGGEEDLLARYLHTGRRFPDEAPPDFIVGGQWEEFLSNPAYARRRDAEQVSYSWDALLEYLSQEVLADRMEFGRTLEENEMALRVMARETRFARRVLADKLIEFRELALRREVRSRIVPSPSGVTYVYFNAPPSFERQERIAELGCRCFIARNDVPQNETVLGIGMNVEAAPQGFALDLFFMSYPEWTEENRAEAENMKRDLGFFENPRRGEMRVEEYPEESG